MCKEPFDECPQTAVLSSKISGRYMCSGHVCVQMTLHEDKKIKQTDCFAGEIAIGTASTCFGRDTPAKEVLSKHLA